MLVNGLHQDFLPISDRAIQYGDGAFETVLLKERRLVYWDRHLDRLSRACKRLEIPFNEALIEQDVSTLIAQSPGNGIIKVIVTRGSGGRGYLPPESCLPTRIVTKHLLPEEYATMALEGICAMLVTHTLSENPATAGLKHLNRLDQVLASLELTKDCQEGLVCTSQGLLVEGIKSNVFLVKSGQLVTPLLNLSGVAGIQRDVILAMCHEQQLPLQVRDVPFAEVHAADEIFLCNSVFGIWPVTEVRYPAGRRRLETGSVTRALQELIRSNH